LKEETKDYQEITKCSETPLLEQSSNHGGGTLGGISTGSDIIFRVAVKPVSTISIS